MSFCISAKEMLQTCGPPDLCFVFLKADTPDDIWVKGLFIFSCHIKKTKMGGNSAVVLQFLLEDGEGVKCHNELPRLGSLLLNSPEGKSAQTTNLAGHILTIMSCIQKFTELKCLLLWKKNPDFWPNIFLLVWVFGLSLVTKYSSVKWDLLIFRNNWNHIIQNNKFNLLFIGQELVFSNNNCPPAYTAKSRKIGQINKFKNIYYKLYNSCYTETKFQWWQNYSNIIFLFSNALSIYNNFTEIYCI